MAYSGRRLKTDPFTDLLFNVLLAFTLLMFLAIIFMNPIPKTGVINPKAEYIITVSWEDNSPDDIDTYVQSPNGDLVWFRGTEAGFVHLDRDDRGLLNDTILVNGEEIQNPLKKSAFIIWKLKNFFFVFYKHIIQFSLDNATYHFFLIFFFWRLKIAIYC